jgi:hypothetical protein
MVSTHSFGAAKLHAMTEMLFGLSDSVTPGFFVAFANANARSKHSLSSLVDKTSIDKCGVSNNRTGMLVFSCFFKRAANFLRFSKCEIKQKFCHRSEAKRSRPLNIVDQLLHRTGHFLFRARSGLWPLTGAI